MSTIIICDICNTRENVEKITLAYDRCMDAAGSMDDVCECFDLCQKHWMMVYRNAAKKLFNNREFELNTQVIKEVWRLQEYHRKNK